jgi:HrpA-like RNA helicase
MANYQYYYHNPYQNQTKQSENIEYWDEKVKKGIFDEEFEHLNPLNGQPWGTNYSEYKNLHKNMLRKLASYTDAKNIFNVVRNHQVTLITMGTGAGKTVMMPKLMLHYYAYQKKVAITIPRKGITETAGVFGANALDCELGKEVGYRHGSDKSKASPETMLLYTTDGTIKAKMTTTDPELSEYHSIIIDEAHERNVNIDVLFTLLKDLCKRRPEFRMIIMSATVDTNVFKNYFEKNGLTFKHYHVATADETPKYTIDKIFLKTPIEKKDAYTYMQQYIDQILKVTEVGDIIAFAHTMTPAMKIIAFLEENRSKYKGNPIFIAYSSGADPEMKDLAEKKDPETNKPLYMTKGYTRCVIIGTPALESSFTAPGQMVYVIDSGLAKDVWYDPIKFSYVEDTVYVTRSSITQRQGRTGRICSGQAYMMYTKDLFDSLKEYNDPTILKSDIMNDILSIMNLPTNKTLPKTLNFMSDMLTPPTVESVEAGVRLLYNYSLINSKGLLTPLGNTIITLGKMGPEIARMVLASYYFGCMDDIILLAAMMMTTQSRGLGEFLKDPGYRGTPEENSAFKKKADKFIHPRGDHMTLINILKTYMMLHKDDRESWCNRLGFKYDTFSKVIEPDLQSIREALETLEFPQMFMYFPPPPKPEEQPKDIIHFFQLHNKKVMDSLFDFKEKPRFGFKYGGGRPKKMDDKLKKLKEEYVLNPTISSRIEHDGISLNVLPSYTFSSRAADDDVFDDYKINNIDEVEDVYKSELDDDDSVISIGVKEYYKSKSSSSSKNPVHLDKKLHDIIKKEYHELHIKDLDIDSDLKKILTMDPKHYNMYQYELEAQAQSSYSSKSDIDDIDDTDDTEIIDHFYINELMPIKKTENELLMEHESVEAIDDSLDNLDSSDFEKTAKESIKKLSNKTMKRRRSRINRTQTHKRGGASYKGKNPNPAYQGKKEGQGQGQGFKGKEKVNKPPVDLVALEKERARFGEFLDDITLKTESGILPILRIFEDPEENIMACVYYGFYMRLATNFYDNKYMVKLSKIDATIDNSTIAFKRETPPLLIYQNLKIANGKANMGVISKLSPRIINAFI